MCSCSGFRQVLSRSISLQVFFNWLNLRLKALSPAEFLALFLAFIRLVGPLPTYSLHLLWNGVPIPFSYILHQREKSWPNIFRDCRALFSGALTLHHLLCSFPQILSLSACLFVLATSPSQRGISPSTTAWLWSSCLAACRELLLPTHLLYTPLRIFFLTLSFFIFSPSLLSPDCHFHLSISSLKLFWF